ncbi:MAG: CpaE family protein [Acidaminococcaceae bacterium]
MTNKIKVLITDDPTMQVRFKQLFEQTPEIDVVAQAMTAKETVEKAKILQPDIIIIDCNLPDLNGFAVAELLTNQMPYSGVILMGLQDGPENLRRAMLAGAKDYIVKPFPYDELLHAIKQVDSIIRKRRISEKATKEGKVITVFSPRGGAGKTVLVANLALALATNKDLKIAIVDASLQFGDVAMLLNVTPKASIADMVTDIEHLDESVLTRYMLSFNDNTRILPAPFQPEKAENVISNHVAEIIKLLKKHFDFIVIDTASIFNDVNLTILDVSDLLLLISAPDITTTKNIRLSLETLSTLGYPHDKIALILNRANAKAGLDLSEMEKSLNREFFATLPTDSELVLSSINRGVPFVLSHPNSQLSHDVFSLAKEIQGEKLQFQSHKNKNSNKGLFGSFRMFFAKAENE